MAATKRLTDKQLVQALALAQESASVELKFTVPDTRRRSAVTALDIDPLDSQVRLVYFFDTPDLALEKSGLVLRARRIQGKGDDSVVKLRPVVPHELPDGIRNSKNVTVELDAMPGGFVCSAAMKNVMGPDAVRTVMMDSQPLHKLFSKEQRAFFAAHAPKGIEIDDLQTLGPILVLKARKRGGSGMTKGKLVAELWHYPDNVLILELSTKTTPADAVAAALQARSYLEDNGFDLSAEQRTKTKTALEFFSRELKDS